MLALSSKLSFSVNIAKFGEKINNKSNDGGKYLAISDTLYIFLEGW